MVTKEMAAALEALQRNRVNPYPELMATLRERKYILSLRSGTGYSITVQGLAALDKAKRQSTN